MSIIIYCMAVRLPGIEAGRPCFCHWPIRFFYRTPSGCICSLFFLVPFSRLCYIKHNETFSYNIYQLAIQMNNKAKTGQVDMNDIFLLFI